MSKWYIVKCRYMEEKNGTIQAVTNPFLMSASSFSDAEAMAYKHVCESEFVKGEFLVREVAIQAVNDVFEYEDSKTWWIGKVEYPVENEFSKETLVKNIFIISAPDIDQASSRLVDCLADFSVKFEIIELKKSKIVDVFPMDPDEKAEEE